MQQMDTMQTKKERMSWSIRIGPWLYEAEEANLNPKNDP